MADRHAVEVRVRRVRDRPRSTADSALPVLLEAPAMSEPIGTYPFPKHGWICFHCGDEFSIERHGSAEQAEAAAREHFGTTPDEDALCRLASRPQTELAARVREAEDLATIAREEAQRAEEEAWIARNQLASLPRLFPGALSPHDVWNQFDSLEGRAEASEAIVRELEKEAPDAVARARAIVCGDPLP
jgi:hypothetical protein